MSNDNYGIEVAQAVGNPHIVDTADYVLVPSGYTVEDLESYHSCPRRRRGTTTLHDRDSFCRYVFAYKDEASIIVADLAGRKIVAILDYHGEKPGWGEFRALYPMPFSEEWNAWTGANKKQMSQHDLANFLEDRAIDIRKPEGAAIIEMARALEATKSVEFKTGQRLADGTTQFLYEETVNAKAGQKGQMKIPEKFEISIPVFKGESPTIIDAKLRYRLAEGGRLVIWYELQQIAKVQDHAFAELCAGIKNGTAINPLLGSV